MRFFSNCRCDALQARWKVILAGPAVDAACLLAFTAACLKMPVPIGLPGRCLASAGSKTYSSSMTTLV